MMCSCMQHKAAFREEILRCDSTYIIAGLDRLVRLLTRFESTSGKTWIATMAGMSVLLMIYYYGIRD